MGLVRIGSEYLVGLLTSGHLKSVNVLEIFKSDFGVVFVFELHENGRNADFGYAGGNQGQNVGRLLDDEAPYQLGHSSHR